MSRVGNKPITIPAGVTVSVANKSVTVEGPKGSLTEPVQDFTKLDVAEGTVTVIRADDSKVARARHGLQRALLQNMVTGVQEGFKKQLEINGVGYKADVSGKTLKLALGFSHPVNFTIPEGIDVSVESNVLTITGIKRQQVGQVAAEIRSLRKPEPYKGKGIKYIDEQIVRKAGKTASGGGE